MLETAEVIRLKYERRGKRAAITKLTTKIDELTIECETNVISPNEVDIKLDNIDAKIEVLKSKLSQLERISSDLSAATQDNSAETYDENEDYMDELNEKFLKVKSWIKQKSLHSTPSSPQFTAPSNFPTVSKTHVQLPKLQLGTFSAKIIEWVPFFDSFNAAKGDNESLGKVQKFQYLRAQLKGEALPAIKGLHLTESYYDHAIAILREKYGRPEKIKAVHMKMLCDMKPPTADYHSGRDGVVGSVLDL